MRHCRSDAFVEDRPPQAGSSGRVLVMPLPGSKAVVGLFPCAQKPEHQDHSRGRGLALTARWEIAVDGKPRSCRDVKEIAIESAHYLKMRNPNVEVIVRDLDRRDDRHQEPALTGFRLTSRYSSD